MTYLSDEELSAIEEELNKTSPNVHSFTMSLEQALALVAELISSRGSTRAAPKSQQIDLFDTSHIAERRDWGC